jgi:precorrin-2 dehydrogenase/sirohydrochlorin ferrochelatase
MRGMDSFPAFLPLAGRRVVIVGVGRETDEKAALFVGAPCDLVRIPADDAALKPEIYAKAALVFIGDCDIAYAEAARAAAKVGGALMVNCVDRPALCDFYTPAIVDRGPVVGAIGTTGQAPGLARKLKGEIDAEWPTQLGGLAAVIDAMKSEARAGIPAFDLRRAFLESLLEGDVAAAALDGDHEKALSLARAALSAWPSAPT